MSARTSPPAPTPAATTPSERGERRAPRAAWAFLLLAAAGVLVPTLPPAGGRPTELALCLLCDERGLADLVANVLLFVPLGLGLGMVGFSARRAGSIAALLSLDIELAQYLFVTGRHASPFDLLCNTTGGALGVGLYAWRSVWLTRDDRLAGRLALAAGLGVAGVALLTGLLLAPSLPSGRYLVSWGEGGGDVVAYPGRIRAVSLGGAPLPQGEVPRPDEVRAMVRAGAPVEVRGQAGPPPPRLAELVGVTSPDAGELFLLGARRNDLVLHLRTRSVDVRLDQPSLRLPGVLAGIAPGAPLHVRAWRERGEGWCARVGIVQRCGVGYTLGSGWGLLLFSEVMPYRMQRALSLGWMVALLLPFGFWFRPRPTGWAGGAAVLLALLVIPPLAGLLPTPPGLLAAALAGAAVGQALRLLVGLVRPLPHPGPRAAEAVR